ncbi:unnamed protein product [Polarella glacialis]|uniref:EF-hand domain-containing protein n=1 Tax=Polarella glacialis TaxID=89957 RepID=A0A813D285_POLGL|nr:unnamed protein product [Polarella glacialis]
MARLTPVACVEGTWSPDDEENSVTTESHPTPVALTQSTSHASHLGSDVAPDDEFITTEFSTDGQVAFIATESRPTPVAASAEPVIIMNGDRIALDDFHLPPHLKDLIVSLDLTGNGEIDMEEVENSKRILEIIGTVLKGKSHEEMHEGLLQLQKLLQNKADNSSSIDYGHFPEAVQKSFKTWDVNGDGCIDLEDLQEAARATQRMQQVNTYLKRGIVVLLFVLLILIVSMFLMAFLAAEAAKDMKPSGSALKTISGDVVQVASTDFQVGSDGTFVSRSGAPACLAGVRCLTENRTTALKVAASTQSLSLSSTLPDETFLEMKSLQLAIGNQSLQLSVTSWERVNVRSSRCGSVVHLRSPNGRLTLDDTYISADAALEQHVMAAGLGALLVEGPHLGLGRRLAATDGMLKGLFNLIQGMEQRCESQALDPPEDLLQSFQAEVRVKISANHWDAMSKIFTDEDEAPLPKPGYEVDADGAEEVVAKAYQIWTEEILSAGDLEVYTTRSAMQPFMREVRIKQGSAEMSMTLDGTRGFHCTITGEQEDEEGGRRTSGSDEMRMEYLGLVEEGGLILRHFRLHMVDASKYQLRQRRLQGTNTPQDEEDAKSAAALIGAGLMPTHMDYFDVDSDPSGQRPSGSPYRVRHESSVPGVHLLKEKTYVQIKPLSGSLTVPRAFEVLNISWLGMACAPAEDMNVTTAMLALMAEAKDIPVVPAVKPPKFRSVEEMPSSILYSYDALLAATMDELQGLEPDPALLLAKSSSPAWAAALLQDPKVFRPILEERVAALTAPAVERSGSDSGARRLALAHAQRQIKEQEEEQTGAAARRLWGRRRRRRRSPAIGFGLEFSQSDYGGLAVEFSAGIGIVSIGFGMETDMRGRIQAISGSASGTVVIPIPPSIEITVGGGIAMTADEISGFLFMEVGASVFGMGIASGLEIGVALDRATKQITEIYGAVSRSMGKMTLTVQISFEPIGGGNYLYKKWDVGFSVSLSRDSWFRRLRFSKTFNLFNVEIGNDHGHHRLRILSSDSPKKCMETGHLDLVCEEHAAMPGVRLGGDSFDGEFTVSSGEGGRVCVERTDGAAGWATDFTIQCSKGHHPGARRLGLDEWTMHPTTADKIIKMGSSDEGQKCVYSEPGTTCLAASANAGRRLGRDNKVIAENSSDSFNVTVLGVHANQVCVQRTDKPEGWNMDLRFLCQSGPDSKSRVVTIGSSRKKNTQCVRLAYPVTCAELSGNVGYRMADRSNLPSTDTFEEAFSITVNGTQVCATRTDSPSGWGMNLRILCMHETKSSVQ